jgi:hypothetical protein
VGARLSPVAAVSLGERLADLFGLITGLPDGLIVWVVRRLVIPASVARPIGLSFAIAFLTVWLVTWLWANGPMRAVFIHWRFHGGRVI